MLTFVNLHDFLPDCHCVVLLAQILCQCARLALGIPHINGDLVSLDLQQDIILLDQITCRHPSLCTSVALKQASEVAAPNPSYCTEEGKHMA